MHPLLRKIEQFNTLLIPYAIGGLFVLIIMELFVPLETARAIFVTKIMDVTIIFIFIIDLLFLAARARSANTFFRDHWLDIVAVFPFEPLIKFLGRFSELLKITEGIKPAQSVFHETLEVSKEAELLARGGRTARISTRIIRLISKSRLFKKIRKKFRSLFWR